VKGEKGRIIDMKFKDFQDTKKCWNIFIDGFNTENHLLVIYRLGWNTKNKVIQSRSVWYKK